MSKKFVIIVVLLNVCWLGGWIYTTRKNAVVLQPPTGVTNLVAFLEARPQPSNIRKFTHNGKMHVEVVGKAIASPFSVPSGPPVYVFDETGTLVDWTADIGDTSAFTRRWSSLSNATTISVEEAKQLVNTKGRLNSTRQP